MASQRICYILMALSVVTFLNTVTAQDPVNADVMHGAGLSGNNADASHMVGLKAMIQNAKNMDNKQRRLRRDAMEPINMDINESLIPPIMTPNQQRRAGTAQNANQGQRMRRQANMGMNRRPNINMNNGRFRQNMNQQQRRPAMNNNNRNMRRPMM